MARGCFVEADSERGEVYKDDVHETELLLNTGGWGLHFRGCIHDGVLMNRWRLVTAVYPVHPTSRSAAKISRGQTD